MKRKLLLVLALLAAAGALAFFFAAAPLVERGLNGVWRSPPYGASERARALHGGLLVADLHADSLLWDRDILERSARGHADVPRLAEGGVAVQAFTVVTKFPYGSNYESTGGDSDAITALVAAGRWPFAAWTSLKQRALHQANKLNDAAARSGGRLVVIRTAGDLARFLERRGAPGGPLDSAAARRGGEAVAAFLGLEGAHALEGDPSNVDALFDAGFRMIAPVHFFDNEWGGSAHGVGKTGLTESGRELVRRAEARGILIDLAHASGRTIDDVLAVATRPVVVSHTGLRGACDNPRNMSDAHARAIAAGGGVIGIGFWEAATCGKDARAVARSVRHAAAVAGVRHVALGSDFDGAVTQPFDATGLVQITDALLAEGFTDEEVGAIMGGNVLRLLSETLPR